ncbi:uncharacterized protein LOC141533997 isoform X2 [Cotesia typhae]|uniref:uncharacterized protein LOC141533997 isoform X2 n=1 Tax=Cotesia typhae TaxID=2053667 RepID=UPI003D69FAFA
MGIPDLYINCYALTYLKCASALPLLGFGKSGIIGGSLAAGWQGPAVAAGSWFATFQSLGATGLGKLLFGAVGSISGGGALGLVYRFRGPLGWCTCD